MKCPDQGIRAFHDLFDVTLTGLSVFHYPEYRGRRSEQASIFGTQIRFDEFQALAATGHATRGGDPPFAGACNEIHVDRDRHHATADISQVVAQGGAATVIQQHRDKAAMQHPHPVEMLRTDFKRTCPGLVIRQERPVTDQFPRARPIDR
nr:hypothetical protein [Paracoccus methylarcula]